MIVKDEAELFTRAVDSVRQYVDEVVICDTGSQPEAAQVAKQLADVYCEFPWCDNFGAAYNCAIEHATGDWILVLDADELMHARDSRRLRALVEEPDCDAIMINQRCVARRPLPGYVRDTQYPMRWLLDNPFIRLFRNRPDIRFLGRVHCTINELDPNIRVKRSGIVIENHTDENPARPPRDKIEYYLELLERDLKERPCWRLYALAARLRESLNPGDQIAAAYRRILATQFIDEIRSIKELGGIGAIPYVEHGLSATSTIQTMSV
ncbi:MAG: glycosyltransferase [Pseudomonadota bacterium]